MIHNIHVEFTIKVTNQDIDDIMATALEGGITYWCDKAEVVGENLGENASEQIARGGSLRLHLIDDPVNLTRLLTIDMFRKGIQQAIAGGWYTEYEWWHCNGIDTCNIDATVADTIIQLALFDDIIYG